MLEQTFQILKSEFLLIYLIMVFVKEGFYIQKIFFRPTIFDNKVFSNNIQLGGRIG